MIDELQISVRAIHDLERSIRVLEQGLDTTQQSLVQAMARCEGQEGSAETSPIVAKARAYIDVYNRAILAANARIDELARGD
jgi:hypothetical protein